jgi:hypothetical protein
MQEASDENASSMGAHNCDFESDAEIEEKDDDGSQEYSPSLYRQQQADENADDSQEDDDGDEIEGGYASCPDLCDSSDEEEYYEGSESTPAAHYASAVSQESLLEKFSELTRHFATLVEQNRKLSLMSRKSASKSLNFDSPNRRRAAPFSPKHRAREQIPATQEDEDYECERDSVRSNSSRSTRIRLQEKFRVIDKISTDSLTPAGQKEWFRKHASQVMAQSGNTDDLDPANDDFGGFKRVQVRSYLFVSIRLAVLRSNFSLRSTVLPIHVAKSQGLQK